MSNSHATVQVIDLTESTPTKKPREIIDITGSDNEHANPQQSTKDKESSKDGNTKRRKRRRNGQDRADIGLSTDPPSSKRRRSEVEEGEIVGENTRRPSRREKSRSPSVNPDTLFFVDAGPATLPSQTGTVLEALPIPSAGLLLPSHVSVFGDAPVEILPPISDSDEEEFIEFIDADDRKGMSRYFDELPDEDDVVSSKKRIICRKCHEEGHMQADCKTQLCLTCGARNEHSTYGCPVNRVCFNCGMKGHLSNQCQQTRGYGQRTFRGCYLCNDDSHQSNECPSLWRIYNYVASDQQVLILDRRKEKSELKLGEGGEGYIATDAWCYNCGDCGHWGDDCNVQHSRDHPGTPSAFGLHNISQGPFASESDVDLRNRLAMKRQPRDWERDSYLPSDWGAGAPSNVGKLGRRKEREKMAKRDQQNIDDEDGDFFSRLSNQKPALKIKGSAKYSPPKTTMKMSFGDKKFPPLPANSLLHRLDMGRDKDRGDYSRPRNSSSSRKPYRRDHSPRERTAERDKDRDRRREKDRNRDQGSGRRTSDRSDKRSDNNFGPQYRGGYSR